MSKYYPAFLDVNKRKCVVIGGGDIGEEKVDRLFDCGAHVKVISPKVNSRISDMAGKPRIEWIPRRYIPGDLEGAFIAILVATNDDVVNAQVSDEASKRNVPLNVVDVTHMCTFIAPSVAIRGEVTVATSTGGASPALARAFRERLESTCSCRLLEYADLAPLLSWARKVVRENKWTIKAPYWQNCINEELLDLVQLGAEDDAREKLISCLEKGAQS